MVVMAGLCLQGGCQPVSRTMKSILAHIDASPRADVRLAFAQTLARVHEAELTALNSFLPSQLN